MNEQSSTPEPPKGWTFTTLGDLISSDGVFVDGDWVESKDQDPNGDVRLIQLADIGDGNYRNKSARFLTSQKAEELNCTFLNPGDVLIARMPDPLGRSCLFPGDSKKSVTVVDVCIIRTNEKFINNKWLMYFINTPQLRAEISSLQSGSTRKRISRGNLATIEFPLPPLNEQTRIVTKIEELFTKLDAGIDALRAIRKQIKRYQQAVLRDAVTGELTKEWRAENQAGLEPAEALLKRILTERRERWEQEQLKKFAESGETPRNDDWKKKYKEPTLPNTKNLPELPSTWIWSSPEMLSTFDDNAICAGPFGTIFKARDFRPSGVSIIFLRHVAPGKYLTKKPGYMDTGKWEELFIPYSVFGGELLITKLGEPPGVCAIYPENIGAAMVTPDVIKMSVDENVANKTFLMHYFNSEIARKFTFGVAFGTTRLRMTLPIFRSMPVPLSSLEEQQKIVEEVERLLSVADAMEQMVEQSLKQSERLRQSILKRAFEGKLVPQEDADEPATVLLERIKQERITQSQIKKVKGKKNLAVIQTKLFQ